MISLRLSPLEASLVREALAAWVSQIDARGLDVLPEYASDAALGRLLLRRLVPGSGTESPDLPAAARWKPPPHGPANAARAHPTHEVGDIGSCTIPLAGGSGAPAASGGSGEARDIADEGHP